MIKKELHSCSFLNDILNRCWSFISLSALVFIFLALASVAKAQDKSLVNTSNSPYAKLHSINLSDVTWTKGFWADRFKVATETMVPNMWAIYNDPKISHAFKNFEIAAGLDTGSHAGPSFHDGDYYKTLEAVAVLYASTKNPKLNDMMDKAIAVIGKSQRADGYIYTKAMIEQRKTGANNQFQDRLSFESYNIGHLMTAGCIHYRATGKTTLLNIAKKATDYLYNFYKSASPTLARNAICPSHYMGVVEMYRTTKDTRYLELAKHLIAIKGKIDDGTDDNQDRIPFLQQTKAMGHAVRANYLYAGVADLYAETGKDSLLKTLNLMWDDVNQHKMYITGGCGSLYDGTSPDGTSYNPADVQKIHQAFGRDYQLPNFTAHNETCANIGNVLWNWRMLQISGDAKYADVMELALHNSVLSGISLDGKNFLYTNPLAQSNDLPFKQRWSKDRVPYIALSNCCPPNVVRTIAEVSDYAYSVSDKGLWFNLYGGNNLSTRLADGSKFSLTQETDYPWDGKIKITMKESAGKAYSIFLRIPAWTHDAKISINGKAEKIPVVPGTYAEIKRVWKKGDRIDLNLPMEAVLIEANPLVEENRNQVAVKRGPVVYCLESTDLPGKSIFNAFVPASTKFEAQTMDIDGARVMALTGNAKIVAPNNWKNVLYKPIDDKNTATTLKLVPYFAWGNRGHSEMSVWLPLSR
ncbi:glycoside hydrolase family 127 protein [Pedobacter sp. HDW13]|uniref:aceric acid hydrolase n=1 Tax=unclassified Pedobacter TaxID=2628915 RepID=UPI000F5B242F|nr:MULTISPECIES: glycoside hydrolase family 127 protein [unclassified Pedobacter]QIL41933.1 glycoside hydrolase family 127 protein [Pedobacter sp. HDW13]RQO68488.1 ATP-binding protein [Pedobacter sp. KBW01]